MSSPLANVKLRFVEDMDDIAEFNRWLGERRSVMGVDTETTGFNFHLNKIRLCQFGDLETGWSIPWDRFSGICIEALDKYEGEIVLHNSPFDARFLIHHSKPYAKPWKWHRTNDTMTMAHLVDPLRPKGLKALASKYVDPVAITSERRLKEGMAKNKWTWETVPYMFGPYWQYAALDPVLTAHMYEEFMPRVNAAYRGVYETEMGVLRVVTNMMLKGARVDLDYCHNKQRELTDWVFTAREWIETVYGIKNATSNTQVIKALQADGIEFTKLTAGGAISLDKEVLTVLAPHNQLAQYVLLIRKAEKNVGPYFKNFIELADSDSRLHPTIWAMGTRTGRMSITEPALQTLPRKDPTVRTAFIPSEGNVLVTSDYDQIEARLMAHFGEDSGLIAAFGEGADFFCNIASEIFQTPITKTDPRRQLTKNTVYGKLYGAGISKMALTAGVEYEHMSAIVNAFDARFPGVKILQNAIDDMASLRYMNDGEAWIKTPTGRRLVADDGKGYTLVNYLIQCHAAEILKRKLIELSAAGMDDYMILPVHDEVVFDVPADDVDEIKNTIERTMENLDDYAVPITCSTDVLALNWGSKYR